LLLPKFAVVDIFAGPGGLAEGFSRVLDAGGDRAFSIALSIEKDPTAHSTLRLRSFLRQFERFPDAYYDFLNRGGDEPDWETLYPEQWKQAKLETWQMELGLEEPGLRLDARLDEIREQSQGNVILIGGPPCQAYSLVGRARNQGKDGYVAAQDGRHFLYEEYIRILDRLRPAAFVMENVKGLLSSSVDGESRIVDRVLDDLRGQRPAGERYRLLALAPKGRRQLDLTAVPRATDFVVRAEDLGIPQARHRVIIVGIREDLAARLPAGSMHGLLDGERSEATVEDVIGGMPRLRSGLSRTADGAQEWKDAVVGAMAMVSGLDTGLPDEKHLAFTVAAARYCERLKGLNELPPREDEGCGISDGCPAELRDWLVDDRLTRLPNHDSRSHMAADLARYFYAAVFAEVSGRSPKAGDYPAELAPAHLNWTTGKFADRFRVQIAGSQSTTVTCHISKDGHYFIHPDPLQCRSLSVREAARLQTFPDNYLFKGGRTEQYVQVGNAVPPLLARRIGDALWSILSRGELSGGDSVQDDVDLPRVA
jgi:DNA (cytosine-5)-methyltransferase 1